MDLLYTGLVYDPGSQTRGADMDLHQRLPPQIAASPLVCGEQTTRAQRSNHKPLARSPHPYFLLIGHYIQAGLFKRAWWLSSRFDPHLNPQLTLPPTGSFNLAPGNWLWLKNLPEQPKSPVTLTLIEIVPITFDQPFGCRFFFHWLPRSTTHPPTG